jgi:hypothetical protein
MVNATIFFFKSNQLLFLFNTRGRFASQLLMSASQTHHPLEKYQLAPFSGING